MAGMISTAFNWDSTVTSLPYRIGVLVFTVVVLVRSPSLSGWIRRSPWLVLFHCAYLIRLLWDLFIARVPTTDEALMTYGAFVIPALAIAPIAGYLRESEVERKITTIGGVTCAMAVVMYFMGWGVERSIIDQTFRLGFEAVNPITLGHLAASTVLASSTLLLRRNSLLIKVPALSILVVAFSCLVLAASRGPFLSMFAGLLVLIFYRGNRRTWTIVAVSFLVLIVVFITFGDGLQLIKRFDGIGEERSSLERLVIQANSIDQFQAHPLFGSSFLELEFLEYPHNMFIETAIALGVVGVVILLFTLYKTWRVTLGCMKQGEFLVPLLFIQYFVGAQLSGAIYGNSALWATVALLSTLAPSSGFRLRFPSDSKIHAAQEPKTLPI